MAADIDEKAIRDPDPLKMTILIARAKAAALLPKITTPSILICSDQVIRCNGEIREKPESEEEARSFLESYRTYPPECIDGVVVYNTLTGESFEGVATAKQHFTSVPDDLINALIKKGAIFTCAGGFTVEDMTEYCGVLEGEIETVQGMPKTLTLELVAKAQASKKTE
jgi:septum formation protein